MRGRSPGKTGPPVPGLHPGRRGGYNVGKELGGNNTVKPCACAAVEYILRALRSCFVRTQLGGI